MLYMHYAVRQACGRGDICSRLVVLFFTINPQRSRS